jgi:hypothetical protein
MCCVGLLGCVGKNSGSTLKNDYIEVTNFNEKTENYDFSFTVNNISDQDITVAVRAFLKTGGVVNSNSKKISKGSSYTFSCHSSSGDFYENPKGIIAIYDYNGEGVGTLSYEFE